MKRNILENAIKQALKEAAKYRCPMVMKGVPYEHLLSDGRKYYSLSFMRASALTDTADDFLEFCEAVRKRYKPANPNEALAIAGNGISFGKTATETIQKTDFNMDNAQHEGYVGIVYEMKYYWSDRGPKGNGFVQIMLDLNRYHWPDVRIYYQSGEGNIVNLLDDAKELCYPKSLKFKKMKF